MHTWVEIYFPELGWYPFDPTPGFGVPRDVGERAFWTASVRENETASPDVSVRADKPGPNHARTLLREAVGGPGKGLGARAVVRVVFSALIPFLLIAAGGVQLLERARSARNTPEAL